MFVKSCTLAFSICVFLFSAPAYAVVAANNGGGGPGGVAPGGGGPGGGGPGATSPDIDGGPDADIDARSDRDDGQRAAAANGMVLSDNICTGGKLASCN